jgi:hypothetical protein
LITLDATHGAVYIFKVNSSDPLHAWTHFQTLPSVHGFNSFFGHSLGMHGDTLVVGAVGFRKMDYVWEGEGNI